MSANNSRRLGESVLGQSRFGTIDQLLATFVRFLGAGALGFVSDAGIFFSLTQLLHQPPILSRCLASAVAIVVTWSINRRYTFLDSEKLSAGVEFLRYFAASLVGAGANLLAFAALKPFDEAYYHIPAYLAGTGAALIGNFILYRTLVFRRVE